MRKRFRIITLVLASIIASTTLIFSAFTPNSAFAAPQLDDVEDSNSSSGSSNSNTNSGSSTGESSDSGGSTGGSSQDGCSYLEGAAAEAAGCNESNDVLKDVIVNILISIIALGGVISAVYIVIGGVKFISSQGSPEVVQEGKKTLLYATIGLVISSLAFIIVNFSIKLIYEDVSGSGTTDSSSEEGEEGEEDTSRTNDDDEGYYGRSPGIGAGPGEEPETTTGGEITNISMLSRKAMKVGNQETLIPHITPHRLSNNASITWISDSPNVVSVDKNGKIIAKNEGVATITATTENGKTATTVITVTKPVEPASVVLEPNKISKLISGKQFNVVATVYPRNATNKHIIWSTDNAVVATVNTRGQITGKRPGTANITARTANGKTASVAVTVVDEEGDVIKITPSLLSALDYYYQTNHHEPISSNCGSSAGSVTCGPASYMAGVYALTKQKIDYLSFVNDACGRWLGSSGAGVDALVTVYKNEYRNRYHVDIKRIPNTWDATVKELKKGHPVIFLVHSIPESVAAQQGYRLTYHTHYVLALSYRNQGGGQIYIWSPVSEKAAPGRNIGDCSAGQCWYDRAAFQRNINDAAWSLQKAST